ncbi:MAG: hypothetical protein ACOCWR_08905 [Oceanidesulfovibrio sp.]
MHNISSVDILKAAERLRSRWISLLSLEGALEADSYLGMAAAGEDDTEQAANLMLALFERHNALDELRDELHLGVEKGPVTRFSLLPGESSRPVATAGRYRCPERGCTTPAWTPQRAGQTVPHCPIHNVLLVKS